MDVSIRRKLTPPQFIRAGVFVCRHIHREGNGGPFLLHCTAGSTVVRRVHRIGHMAHSTQLTISAMHAHIKATKSIIPILSLSTGSRTLLPHPPAQPPHTHHQIHVQDSQQPSHTRTSSNTRAQGTTRSRTVTIVIIAVIITRSGVAGVSERIRETEGKEIIKQKGEGQSAADTAGESRQHEERAAGPAAQFTHHETASTTISSQLISAAPGKSPKPRGHHTTHTEQAPTTPVTRASEPSAIHDAAKKYPAIPPSMGHGAQLNVVT
ncbi:hypothetical protein MOQ_000949, partial [Trypanosoma cruzi marinkellei]